MSAIHPAPARFSPEQIGTDPILHFFHYAHLPAALQSASQPFCDLAAHIVDTLPRNAERSVALRKLLEAKDAAVRANVGAAPVASGGSFIDRLKTERDELFDRLQKLRTYLDSNPQGLSTLQAAYLYDQRNAMQKYLDILFSRIEDLEGTEPAPVPVDIGEPCEVGGHDIDRDGPIPFDG